MNLSIKAEIANEFPEKVVEAIYFAMRYIKQASRARRMDKNIFQDAEGNLPSSEVVSLTMKIVRRIEQLAGAEAERFDPATFSEVFDFLSATASGLKGQMTQQDRQEAEALAEELAVLPAHFPG